MAKLPKFTLQKNEKTEKWDLANDATERVVKSFETKAAATKGGTLEKAVGSEGGICENPEGKWALPRGANLSR